ncbi:putative RNA methyltransferase [Jeotgalibacillus salarius]|uniref:Methyltransferase domain-containing protein n=1 Tax=Jeotgalibacillus salarius TaxID=546023 RepID=A0A4Y8LJ05_9BACL|nr:methyltransferase domain-containing protein [Jeotgalibacillus salarius]TFE02175.1 methyltransferase domain-containing protein [Jeotgalibacillus salarius]
MKLKKREAAALRVNEEFPYLLCPICRKKLTEQSLSLTCSENHQFDFAKNGSLHLLTKNLKTKYTKDLFESRHYLMSEAEFFKPAINEVITHLKEREAGIILDAGCGEGTHLAHITGELEGFTGVGIDLAKDGIQLAARHYDQPLWITADLARAPVEAGTVDYILNILSPANYQEFNRLLKNAGEVIKIVPGAGYLKELRNHYFGDHYENDETVSAFYEQFDVFHKITVTVTQKLDRKAIEALVNMTPLSWSADPEKVTSFKAKQETEMTLDVEVLFGRKRR